MNTHYIHSYIQNHQYEYIILFHSSSGYYSTNIRGLLNIYRESYFRPRSGCSQRQAIIIMTKNRTDETEKEEIRIIWPKV